MQVFGSKNGGRHSTNGDDNRGAANNDGYEYEYATKQSTEREQPVRQAQPARSDTPVENRPKKKKKKGKAGKVILIILLCLIVLCAAAYVYIEYFTDAPDININGLNNEKKPDVAVDGRKPGVYTLLVAGVDVESNNTDTIMVGQLDTVNHTLNVVSIPRDTLTNIKHEVKKANSVYHYADYYSKIADSSYYGQDAVDVMRRDLIKAMCGFDVDGYVIVNVDAAAEVVDAIGGVTFDVPMDMHYVDRGQNLFIDIPAGEQRLNGDNFVKMMRFRSAYAGGDIDRIEMQHKLLKALATQTLQLKNIPNLNQIVEIVSNNMNTSLSSEDMLFYAKEFMKLKSEDIHFYTMPGNTNGSICGASYVFCDIDAWLDMVNDYLNPWEERVTTKNVNIVTYENGNFYSTTGELAGGVSSFLGYSSNSSIASASVLKYESTASQNSNEGDENDGAE